MKAMGYKTKEQANKASFFFKKGNMVESGGIVGEILKVHLCEGASQQVNLARPFEKIGKEFYDFWLTVKAPNSKGNIRKMLWTGYKCKKVIN